MKTKFYLLNFFLVLLLLSNAVMAQDKLETPIGINTQDQERVSSVKNFSQDIQNAPNIGDDHLESLTPAEGFEGVTFPPTGWTYVNQTPGITATQYWTRQNSATVGRGAFGLSFSAARFNCWSATNNVRQYIQSPNFPATVSGEVLRFDWAYGPYASNSAARDTLIIQTSTDGVNFTDLLIMWGDTTSNIDPNQNLCTAIRNTAQFTPLDNQWASKQLLLPVGTVAVRFIGVSQFGNDIWLDNIFTGVPGSAMSGTYTINFANPTGGTNYQTFRDAADALHLRGVSGPVTFNVAAGTYGVGNRFILNPVAGTSSTNRITFQASGGSVVLSDTGTASTSDYMVMLSGVDWVTMDGINITGVNIGTNGLTDRGYYLNSYRGFDGARHNVIKNNTIFLVGSSTYTAGCTGVYGSGPIGGVVNSGIVVTYPGSTLDSNAIQNVSVNKCDRGINIFIPTSTLPVSGTFNLFHNNIEISNCRIGNLLNVGSPTAPNCLGILLQGTYNAEVFGNRIDSLRNVLVSSTTASTGIALQVCTGRFYNNVVAHMYNANTTSATPVLTALQVGPVSGGDLYTYNNLVYGVTKAYTGAASATIGVVGINITNFQAGATATTINHVFNNTIVLNTGAPVPYSTAAINMFAANLPVYLENNCIINTVSTTAVTAKSYGIGDPNTIRTLLRSNYNNIYVPGTNGFTGAYGTGLATTTLTLADWKAGSTGDTNSVAGDVSYISLTPLNIDATVAGNWVLNGKGNPKSIVTTDINGAPRNTSVSQGTSDIGANEFNMSVNPSFATESAAPVAGGTSIYTQFGDTVCIVTWGTGGTLPTGLNIMNMTGNMPPNSGTSHHLASYMDVAQVGGPLSGTSYNMTMKFGYNQLFNITNVADMRLAKQNGTFWTSYLDAGTGSGQTNLDAGNRRISVNELNSFSNFTATDISDPLSTTSLAPGLLLPPNNSTTVIPNNPKLFRWNKSIEGVPRPVNTAKGEESDNIVSNYLFQLYADTNSAPIFQDSTLTDTTFIYNPDLTALTPYWWRVKAKNENGWGPFASYFKFTTDQVSGLTQGSEIPTVYDLFQNYPNPFNPTTSIKFDIPTAGFVSLKVYDITGREVANLVNGVLEPASYNVSWNGSQFSSGVYFYRIQAGDFVKVQKMILTK